jgi:signal transduction histidine kinase
VSVRERLVAVWRAGLYLLATAGTGFVSLLMLTGMLFVLITVVIGTGWLAMPNALKLLHSWASFERRRIARFTGETVPEPVPPSGTVLEQLRASRRELVWLVLHAATSGIIGLAGATLPVSALNAVVVPLYWWAVPEDEPVTSPFPVTSWGLAALMPLVALGYALLSVVITPWIGRWHSRWMSLLLAPPPGARLAERVAELTASRAAALEAHGAELRRIERDLHDDTQNRLVAVAMHLGIVERALRRDPAAALPMVLKAQDAASDALAGLRGVVRSIYPPVLAERGLDGAVAGLIARCAVPTTLTTTGLRRVPAAVESAAYFVVAEALTNVAKHSGAEQCEVRLTCTDRPETLVIEVHDDGHGGAEEADGTGLLGIRRRVAAFDGATTIDSPNGGPTVLRVELPCGS